MTAMKEPELIRKTGFRLKQAREMTGLTQVQAAEAIGFQNSSGLSKIEAGTNRAQLPLWVVRQAASVYEVSADWLLSLTDDWEPEARLTERATAQWVFTAWDKARSRDVQAMVHLDKMVRAVAITAKDMATAAINLRFAVDAATRANGHNWDGLRMILPVERQTTDLKNQGEGLLRKLEKMGIHRRASAEQITLALINPHLLPEQLEDE